MNTRDRERKTRGRETMKGDGETAKEGGSEGESGGDVQDERTGKGADPLTHQLKILFAEKVG